MSTPTNGYPAEKASDVEVLPAPATSTDTRAGTPPARRSGLGSRLFKCGFTVISVLLVLKLLYLGFDALPRGCHGLGAQMSSNYHPIDDGGHQHPFPPIGDWKPFQGTTHFEFEPAAASGFSVRGAQAFGKVVFEASKLSDKVVIDLDIKTSKKDKDGEVTVKEENGYLTVDTPNTGKMETYASAKIQIPSNIIGKFVMPQFQVDVGRHMVDFSGLPESLEIDTFKVRIGQGFVKPGPVHTNTTKISIGHGALKGSLIHAAYETNIDVAHGNVTLDIPDISSGSQGATKIHLGNGHLKGTLSVYNSTTVDVASGGIYIGVDFKHSDRRASLSTKIAAGNSRVYVNSIAAERLLESSHSSINGDQLITYPSNFQGTIDARGVLGDIKLAGKDLAVEKVIGGLVGRQGDSNRNSVTVKSVRGKLDILVGDE
ncbi:hypothetical protein CLCR_00645 [Cladophialophora carrionii]|uniref:Adhesin domain-containing protein n=1 Tax=Cladophialophora carrionii TaxID=86049 RepID=A0A1C1C6P8_9EURO|nr:hypothetical protein CLCR_00645 [Cladophialophora carrionii]